MFFYQKRKNQKPNNCYFCLKVNKTGFSLIEMLVYTTILSAIFILVVNTIFIITGSYSSIKATNNINESASLSFERLTREIRQAQGLDLSQSIFDVHPGRLVLNTVDNQSNPITMDFYLEDDVLKLKKDGILLGPLTLDDSQVTNLIFTNTSATTSSSVRIEMTIESSDRNSLKSKNFYTSAVLRGSY